MVAPESVDFSKSLHTSKFLFYVVSTHMQVGIPVVKHICILSFTGSKESHFIFSAWFSQTFNGKVFLL